MTQCLSAKVLHERGSGRHIELYLVGVGCVGKTTIGARLAERLGVTFIDLDAEVERTFGMGIGRIQARFLTNYSYRIEAAKVLKDVLAKQDGVSFVMALPPSGLRDAHLRVLKKRENAVVVALVDRPEAILERITFYDDDGKKLDVTLTDRQRRLYLVDIKKDITYFKKSYARANVAVDLDGAGIEESAERIASALSEWFAENGDQSNPVVA